MLGLKLFESVRLEQKITLRQKHFGDFICTTNAVCPDCKRIVNTEEIMAGFSDNPYDFNTTCPNCKKRFLSHLIITDKETGKGKELFTVVFMCQAQTLEQMKIIKKERGRIGIAYLAKHNRHLFYNMIKHWASYEKALIRLKDLN